MNPDNQSENPYVSELKSLMKDKFFMLLLGISVTIVLISTVYSLVRPKSDTGEVASGTNTVVAQISPDANVSDANKPDKDVSPTLAFDETAGIVGLETVEGTEVTDKKEGNVSIFDSLKEKAQGLFGDKKAKVAEKQDDTGYIATDAQPVTNLKVGQNYVVVEGDNLWTIAEKVYSSGYNFVDIASANNIGNPDYIEIGQKIMLPSVTPKESTVGDITPQAAMTKSEASVPATHTVVEGDSLWVIAQKQYNDPYQWTRISELNPTVTNPDFIMPGQVLKLK